MVVARVERFEDLEAWKQARELSAAIYRATGTATSQQDYGLRNQIRRAAVSIVSNMAEGFERGGNREFRPFLAQARGSAGEVWAQFYVALDAGLIERAQFDALKALAGDASRLVAGLMRYLAETEYQGSKAKSIRDEMITLNFEP
jgi:four helix bundle protein